MHFGCSELRNTCSCLYPLFKHKKYFALDDLYRIRSCIKCECVAVFFITINILTVFENSCKLIENFNTHTQNSIIKTDCKCQSKRIFFHGVEKRDQYISTDQYHQIKITISIQFTPNQISYYILVVKMSTIFCFAFFIEWASNITQVYDKFNII